MELCMNASIMKTQNALKVNEWFQDFFYFQPSVLMDNFDLSFLVTYRSLRILKKSTEKRLKKDKAKNMW